MNEWNPNLDEAPLGENVIVVCDTDDGKHITVMWRDFKTDSRGKRTGTFWVYEGEPTFSYTFYIQPTHWMPLPDPPEES